MALIPLRQTVIIRRQGEVDRWGNEITPTQEIEMRCRVEEGAKLTRRTSALEGANSITSEEVVSSARFIFDKFADVRLTDELYYTDESGQTRVYLPLNINRIRGLNGRTLLTVVEV